MRGGAGDANLRHQQLSVYLASRGIKDSGFRECLAAALIDGGEGERLVDAELAAAMADKRVDDPAAVLSHRLAKKLCVKLPKPQRGSRRTLTPDLLRARAAQLRLSGHSGYRRSQPGATPLTHAIEDLNPAAIAAEAMRDD